MKKCTTCKQDKPSEGFYTRRKSTDGLALICIPCQKAKAKRFYQASKDRVKLKAREWALANPDRRKEIADKSAQKHIERKRDSGREYQRLIRRLNPEAARAKDRRYTAIRRAREMQNGGTISQEMWDALFSLFEFRTCLYCGHDGCNLVMDHFVPVVAGGRTEAGNLLPCCRACNASKNAKLPQDWLQPAAYASIKQFLDITREAELAA